MCCADSGIGGDGNVGSVVSGCVISLSCICVCVCVADAVVVSVFRFLLEELLSALSLSFFCICPSQNWKSVRLVPVGVPFRASFPDLFY